MGLDLDTEQNSILYPDPASGPVISGSTILLKTATVILHLYLEHISLLFLFYFTIVQITTRTH